MNQGEIRRRMDETQMRLDYLNVQMGSLEGARDDYDRATYETLMSSYRTAAAALDRRLTDLGFELQDCLRQ